MELEKTLTLILSELKDVNQHMISMENRMDSLENRMGSLENRMDSLENRIDSLENRMGSLENRMDSLENRMDVLEQGQQEIQSNLADLTEQVKENTLFIRALVDGHTVLETKLRTVEENTQQLFNRTQKLERISGGILYHLALREDDLL